jgi:divalent metal cation (Fe/Co/Zn/Cd) transporter
MGRDDPGRPELVGRALRLEYLTVGWNILEGLIAIAAAAGAGSVALLGFGIDSVIESVSAGVLVWRLHAERSAAHAGAVERLDRTAHRLVGSSLFVLAAFVAADAAWTLWRQEQPRPTILGIIVTASSLFVMVALAHAKRRAAKALGSRALEADSFQTTACWWLSLAALAGIALNAALGWWWADPVAALGMTYFLVREGLEGWEDESRS